MWTFPLRAKRPGWNIWLLRTCTVAYIEQTDQTTTPIHKATLALHINYFLSKQLFTVCVKYSNTSWHPPHGLWILYTTCFRLHTESNADLHNAWVKEHDLVNDNFTVHFHCGWSIDNGTRTVINTAYELESDQAPLSYNNWHKMCTVSKSQGPRASWFNKPTSKWKPKSNKANL